jgi:hypothetical protein
MKKRTHSDGAGVTPPKKPRLHTPNDVIVIEDSPVKPPVPSASSSSSSTPPLMLDAMPVFNAFFLNEIPGVDDHHSSILIDQIVSGAVQEAYLFNYQVDVEFLMTACPVLQNPKVPVHIVHGERAQRAALLTVRVSVWNSYLN